MHPNVRTSLRRVGKFRPRGAREVLHHLSRQPVRVHQPLPQAQLAPEVRHPRETLVPQESPEIPKVQQLRYLPVTRRPPGLLWDQGNPGVQAAPPEYCRVAFREIPGVPSLPGGPLLREILPLDLLFHLSLLRNLLYQEPLVLLEVLHLQYLRWVHWVPLAQGPPQGRLSKIPAAQGVQGDLGDLVLPGNPWVAGVVAGLLWVVPGFPALVWWIQGAHRNLGLQLASY